MSFVSATAAQRREIRDEAEKVAKLAQPWAQRADAPTADQGTVVETGLTALQAAINAVGSFLPATQTIVSNGQALTGVAPSGTYTDTVTFTVAAGAITAIVLS